MKKTIFLLILLLFIIGCKELTEKEIPKTLSELQITACDAADKAGSCDTRLIEVGIVMKEECCQILGKCC